MSSKREDLQTVLFCYVCLLCVELVLDVTCPCGNALIFLHLLEYLAFSECNQSDRRCMQKCKHLLDKIYFLFTRFISQRKNS